VLEADVAAARDQFRAAVLADPTWAALGDLHEAEIRRNLRHSEAVGDAARLGVTAALPTASPAGTPTFAVLVGVLTAEAARRVADEADARDAERTAVGEKAAR